MNIFWSLNHRGRTLRQRTLAALSHTLLAFGLTAAEDVAVQPLAPSGTPPEGSGPKIRFAEATHDFGQIKRGETMKHSFVFTNVGAAMLEITDVRPGCGCTTAGTWDRQIAPGKTGSIPIQFASGNFSGAIAKSVTVTCNDPAQPNAMLQIKGTVWTPVELTPLSAMFQYTAETTNSETRIVKILNHQPEPLTLEEPQNTNRAFTAQLRTVKPGQEFELAISTVPPIGSGTVMSAISVKTSSREVPLLTVQAYALERPAVTISPTQIFLPPAPLPAAIKQTVTIMGAISNPLVLSDPHLNVEGLEVQMREVQPGRMFLLTVAFPTGFELPQGQSSELTVKSNHPKYPLIKVPITQSPRAATAPAQAAQTKANLGSVATPVRGRSSRVLSAPPAPPLPPLPGSLPAP